MHRTLRGISLRRWSGAQRVLPAHVETSTQCPMPILLDEDYPLFIGSRPRQSTYTLPLEPSAVDVISNATVLGDKLVVASEDGHVFFETYWSPANLHDGRLLRLVQSNPPVAEVIASSPASRIDRAILLGNPMTGNYHHWIINCLPRLRGLELYPQFADWPLLVQHPLAAFGRDSLLAMGIAEQRLVEFDGGILHVDELVIPSNGVFAATELRWVRERVHQRLGIQPGGNRRLYISRADADIRRVTSEPEVIGCLQRHGFEPLRFSELAFAQQVQAMAEAEVIAGPHGAGLTNMVFGADRLKVIEFHPADLVNYCFWLTASAMKQRYAFLAGKPINAERDMTIDLDRLERLLQCFGL